MRFVPGNGKSAVRTAAVMVLLIAVLVTAAATEAKEGLYLGAEMVFADIGGAVNAGHAISAGDGAGITAGYGVSRNFAVEASFQSTDHPVSDGRTVTFRAGGVGIKASLPIANSYIEPYLLVGIGKYMLDTVRGDGWRYGGGMDIRLSPAFSLTVGMTRDTVDMGTAPAVSGTVTSMNIGIAYRFR